VANGIHQVLFITGRSKTSIENHFDLDPELQRALEGTNKADLLQELQFEDSGMRYFYTRQRMQRGLGDAILCGENFAGEQPFVVALGDSILGLNAESRAISRMVDLFESRSASCVLAVEEVDGGSSFAGDIGGCGGGDDDSLRRGGELQGDRQWRTLRSSDPNGLCGEAGGEDFRLIGAVGEVRKGYEAVAGGGQDGDSGALGRTEQRDLHAGYAVTGRTLDNQGQVGGDQRNGCQKNEKGKC